MNKKQNKKGFVKDFTNNNLSMANRTNNVTKKPGERKSILEKIQEFIAGRENYALFYFQPSSKLTLLLLKFACDHYILL